MTGLMLFGAIVLLLWAEITVFGLIGSAVGALVTIVSIFITAGRDQAVPAFRPRHHAPRRKPTRQANPIVDAPTGSPS